MKDGVLYTAGEGILLGSVREAVLRRAEELDIPIVLEPPHIDDVDTWDAAFISSTSRMLLPIDTVTVCSECSIEGKRHVLTVRDFDHDAQPLVGALENAVMEDILSSSESIFITN
jgi:branched-subunit amino acid aminotransferase/4-amino-4-deoxychorismate lyase